MLENVLPCKALSSDVEMCERLAPSEHTHAHTHKWLMQARMYRTLPASKPTADMHASEHTTSMQSVLDDGSHSDFSAAAMLAGSGVFPDQQSLQNHLLQQERMQQQPFLEQQQQQQQQQQRQQQQLWQHLPEVIHQKAEPISSSTETSVHGGTCKEPEGANNSGKDLSACALPPTATPGRASPLSIPQWDHPSLAPRSLPAQLTSEALRKDSALAFTAAAQPPHAGPTPCGALATAVTQPP